MMLPRREPLTLDLPPSVGRSDVELDHAPAGRAARTSNSSGYPDRRSTDPKAQQRVPLEDPHRCDVVHRQAVPGAQPPAHHPPCPPGRPTASATPVPAAPADHQVGALIEFGNQPGQITGVHRPVRVDDRHNLGRRR